EKTIPLCDIISQLSSSIVNTTSPPILPIEDPENSLVIGNEDLNTIPEKESDEVIKSSVEDLVLIRRKSMAFSNPLFDSNNDFTSSDGESLFNEDVLEDNVKIYSNPLFEFDDEYISSDVNPLFDEVLEKIVNNDSYDPNLDEPALLVTPLFDSNKDECFDSRGDIDEIDAFLDADVSMDIEDGYHDSKEDIIYLIVCLLMTLFLISLLRSEGTIFDPGVFAFHFSSLEPVASHRSGTFMCFNVYPNILNESPMEICCSTRFNPNNTMI
nr:hypothetical protein [Tanacetum cinerariifolium]